HERYLLEIKLLEQLQRFLKILDGEKLSGNATVQKGLLMELLQSYKSSDGGDEEYIYMNKVIVTCQNQDKTYRGEPASPSLLIDSYTHFAFTEDTEPVSSSYESYDEEEVTKGKSTAQHQWPSPEASIELMKDARICAFLWRKKWLGQWAKQLCVIREHRLLCYKSSKDQTPLLDISLLGCSVVYKEKQTKRKEHKLKITPLGGEAIVLGLQSKEQAEQWLKVRANGGEQSERYSVASESGSSTDSHAENLENKDVKKKYGKFSNLMNIGKKKVSSLENPEKTVDTSGYLNVLVNTQWKSRWCSVRDRQLWIYNDKSKSKASQQPVALEGCMVLPDPSPEHLYSFRIQMHGEELATIETKSSADMGHWLGLILSQTGTKTDPEDLTYDYVNSERISSIVNAAKTSMYLMQRRYSEPNTYTDSPPSDPHTCDDIYDDVPSTENEQEVGETHLPSYLQYVNVGYDSKLLHIPSCLAGPGSVEVKLGKNRTEADVRRYTDERDRLEREREEVKNTLATLRKDRREVKEELSSCQDPTQQASLEARLKQMEETCREAERRRVEVELSLMEVKENLRKVEAGPFTLGTTVDSSLLETSTPKMAPVSSPAPNTPTNTTNNGDSPVNSATALKNRPLSIMASGKGNVLQKAKEWEKKSTT
uniref:Actin filament-associated protein 1-like 2 n=1 Tax=Sinocyclocheilus rhinocerous TaxID=307959 RepID=A0A673MWB1_9TELE